MADSRDGQVQWYAADPRTIMPLDTFHVPHALAKRVRQGTFRMTGDTAFHQVITACAQPRPYAEDTWINDQIIDVYTQLHDMGFAHSIEAWQDDQLVGGLYGVALGGAFFGESMFSRRTDASKVCLVRLVEHLKQRGYILLDVQFSNPHLEQFGVEDIARERYLALLEDALQLEVTFSD